FEIAADTAVHILNRLHQPVAVNDVKIIKSEQVAQQDKSKAQSYLRGFNWLTVLVSLAVSFLVVVILVTLSPWLIWRYFHLRARESLYYIQRAISYLLNQMGYPRDSLSPEAYARDI